MAWVPINTDGDNTWSAIVVSSGVVFLIDEDGALFVDDEGAFFVVLDGTTEWDPISTPSMPNWTEIVT